ncbi:MAG: hypothetical protein ACMUIA_05965 [bacterium]
MMKCMKHYLLALGLSVLLIAALVAPRPANAQFLYPPVVPFYGYGLGLGYYPVVPPVVPYTTPFPYRGAQALITQLALLGALPTTTTTSTLFPTTTSTIGTTTALLLGGSSTTSLLLASTLAPTTTYPTTTYYPTTTSSTLGITTALLLGGSTSTTTLLALGI